MSGHIVVSHLLYGGLVVGMVNPLGNRIITAPPSSVPVFPHPQL